MNYCQLLGQSQTIKQILNLQKFTHTMNQSLSFLMYLLKNPASYKRVHLYMLPEN